MQSVARALRVLEVVGDLPGLPVKVIARRTGLNLSTTYHLVRTLAYQGYLRRLPDGRYVLGGEVARRFHALVASLARPPQSSVVLQHLAGRTALSAYLGRLSDGRVLIADLAEGPGSPYLEDMEVGLDVAIHATALGKALLAALPPRDRRAYLTEARLRPYTSRTRTERSRLEQELRAMPPDSPVVEHGEFRDGVACAAAMIPQDNPGTGPWAVVVSTRGEDIDPRVCAEVMIAAHDLAGAV